MTPYIYNIFPVNLITGEEQIKEKCEPLQTFFAEEGHTSIKGTNLLNKCPIYDHLCFFSFDE